MKTIYYLIISLITISICYATEEIPSSGKARIKQEKKIDDIIKASMTLLDASGATMTISKKGRPIYSKVFGYIDSNKTTLVTSDTTFRIASNSKPILATLVLQLVKKRKLKLTDKAIQIVNKNLDKKINFTDNRFKQITIQDLLDHKGGWDRDSSYDPVFYLPGNEKELKSMKPIDLVRYMATQKLDFTPGQKAIYSNFGYVFLARVVESVTGMPYKEYLEKKFLKSLRIKNIAVGKNIRNTNLNETNYPKRAYEDNIEVMDGAGGLIANSVDLCKFLDKYWISGKERNRANYSYIFYGSLPGVTSITYQKNNLSFAVIFNNRRDSKYKEDSNDIKDKIVKKLNGL